MNSMLWSCIPIYDYSQYIYRYEIIINPNILQKKFFMHQVTIVIDIRKLYDINDRDPLEIFTDNGGQIILKKYDPLPSIQNHLKTLQDTLTEGSNYTPEITKKAVGILTELEKLLYKKE